MKKNKTEQLNRVSMITFWTKIGVCLSQNKFKSNPLKLSNIFVLMTFGLLAIQNSNAQNTSVNVTVVDQNNKPLSGVLIGSTINPDKTGITDKDGNAVLEIDPKGFLKIFHNDIEKTVSLNKTNLKVVLEKKDKKVDVGYGNTKTTDQITTSLDVVYSDKLDKSSLLNPMESLYGKLKGLMVLQNGGEAWNRNPTFMIRGQGTLGSNRVLFIIDGFERDLATLSLQDIESVSVLKDGTDVAKFGNRGANGVVLVTTKRGQKDGFHAEVSYDRGLNMAFRKPKFLDAFGYAKAVNQANINDGMPLTYSELDLADYKNGTSPFSHPNVDWWDATLKDHGQTNNLNTSFWGGGKSSTYFVSLNYQNERGLIDNTNLDPRYNSEMKYDRLNFRANLDIDLTKTTKFLADASGNIGGYNEPYGRTDFERKRISNDLMNAIYSVPSAVFPIKRRSGDWGGTEFYANNPVAIAAATGINKPNFRTLYANGRLKQDLGGFVKGLSAEVAVSYDTYASYTERRNKSFQYQNFDYVRINDKTFTVNPTTGAITDNFDPLDPPRLLGTKSDLSYADGFGDQIRHATGQGRINFEREWNNNNKFFASVMYQEDKRVNDNQYNTFLRQNFMATSSYSYKNKYFVDAVVSYSGTNVLPKATRFGYFPAVSAGWIISHENFLKDSKTINFLKLRGSWGLSGNDLMTQNLSLQAYETGGNYFFGINNTTNTGIREGRLAAEGLTFETSEKINIGINLQMFKDLTINLDAFRDNRTDIVISTVGAVPSLIGVKAAEENAGKVLNQGIEASLLWKSNIDKFKYFIGGNVTYAKNEIIDSNEEYRPYDYLKRTGLPNGQQFGLESLGFFKDQADIDNSPKQVFSPVRPGDVKYKDQNNDGLIDDLDNVAIGYSGTNPEIYYALNFGAEMQGFGIDILLQGIANQTLYLNTKSVFLPLVGLNNISEFSNGAWTPETADTATLPRLSLFKNDNNNRESDIWLQSGNYLKLRHFEFYYNVPESLTKRLKMNKAKLYARGMNLFSIDNINIVDPEAIGITYPTLASYHLGIKFEF